MFLNKNSNAPISCCFTHHAYAVNISTSPYLCVLSSVSDGLNKLELKGSSYLRQQKKTRSTFALRSSSATRLFPTRRNRHITLIASALCGCVFNTERLHTVPLIQIRREPLVSGGSMDAGPRSRVLPNRLSTMPGHHWI